MGRDGRDGGRDNNRGGGGRRGNAGRVRDRSRSRSRSNDRNNDRNDRNRDRDRNDNNNRRYGGGGGGSDHKNNNNAGSNNNSHGGNNTNFSGSSNNSGPPSYHFHLRRAVRGGVEDNDFLKALLPEGTRIEVDELLGPMCNACDSVAEALPTEAPIDFERLASAVKNILTSHPKCLGNMAAANRFTAIFIQRAREHLFKIEPRQQQQQQQQAASSSSANNRNNNSNKGRDDNNAREGDDRPSAKQLRTEKGGRGAGKNSTNNNEVGGADQQQQQDGGAPLQPTGGILGDAPLPPPRTNNNNGGGALFSAPPPMGCEYGGANGYGNNGVLAPPPMMLGGGGNGIHIPMPRSYGGGQQGYNNNNQQQQYHNGQQYNSGRRGGGQGQQQNNNSAPFMAPAAFKPAPCIGTRYVTMRGIPQTMATREAIKGALEMIVNGMKNQIPNVFFLNYEVFTTEAVAEGGVPSYYAVVSFNSFSSASEVVDRINRMSVTDGSPVTAEGSSAEEIGTFWGDQRDKLEALEMEILHHFTALDTAKATAQTIEARLVAMAEETAAADADIAANSGDAEKKEALKDALKRRIALNKEKEELFAQRKANNEAAGIMDPYSTELAAPERFSSSSAQPTNPRHLLYIADVPAPLSDAKVLFLLGKLEMNVMHIWRDGESNMLCVEMHVFGAVLGALRRLDFLDFSFAGMRFTNEKPRKA